MLYKELELISNCRHKRKFKLEAWSNPKIKKDLVAKEIKPCEIKIKNKPAIIEIESKLQIKQCYQKQQYIQDSPM